MEKLRTSSRREVRWVWFLSLLLAIAAVYALLFSPPSPSPLQPPLSSSPHHETRFLQVPQIAWGLNNQKIALARALLTARFLNRSLLLPSLSASLTYKDTFHIQPLPFDRLFSLPKFNKLCQGFVAIAKPPAKLLRGNSGFNISKGSGRRWTKERDLQQLLECREPQIHHHSLLRISGKNPFLWHDHWPVLDYAKIFQCLVLVEEISADVDQIVSKLNQRSLHLSQSDHRLNGRDDGVREHSGYVAVHMRIEKDWMIHCKKTEERVRTKQGEHLNICSSKQEILDTVSGIPHLSRPSLVYLAVADVLLEDMALFPMRRKV